MHLIATCAFGLESLVEKELRDAKIWTLSKQNGRVDFQGEWAEVIRSNYILRCADRVYLHLAEFEAKSFDQLFDHCFAIPWADFLPKTAKITVLASSNQSQLHGVPTIQSISQKAIFKKMSQSYGLETFPQTGPEFEIQIKFQKDHCLIALNTSGTSLHRRGYRQKAGEAPLKETLAAAMLQLTLNPHHKTLIDPFCGSGTIPIEAAMISQKIAPGLQRNFAYQNWPITEIKSLQKTIYQELTAQIQPAGSLQILGADLNPDLIKIAKQNAKAAGVEKIQFSSGSFASFPYANFPQALLLTNPPYGERLEEVTIAEQILADLGHLSQQHQQLEMGILTPSENFNQFFGRPANQNRKLYNGKIKCYLQIIKKNDSAI